MKNVIIGLQVVILIAVGVLFYRSYSQESSSETAAVKTESADTVEELEVPVKEAVLPAEIGANDLVVYYDSDKLIEKSKYIKRLQDGMNAQLANYEKTIRQEQYEYSMWVSRQRELIEKKLMSQAEMTKTQMDDQEKQATLEQHAEEAEKACQKIQDDAIDSMQKSIKKAIKALNKDKKIKYVLISTKILKYFVPTDEAVDITDAIAAQLDNTNKK
ncbi:MAG: OmpH family outer membrane protein [Flavobacteriales bacterium]